MRVKNAANSCLFAPRGTQPKLAPTTRLLALLVRPHLHLQREPETVSASD